MMLNRTLCSTGSLLLATILLFIATQTVASQEKESRNGISWSWATLQAVPSLSWTSFPTKTQFSLEWEITPVLYSFGMNKLDPRWHLFFVTQPERFAGSIEFNISTQLYPYKVRTGYWGFSGQLLAHLPLVERGEHLGLNLGAAHYIIDGSASNYFIVGFSTLFGFLHYNVKYSPAESIWMHSIEFRLF